MEFHLRPAAAEDSSTIRALVRTARLNPTALDWRRFVVTISQDGDIIGCGQVKPHRDNIRELASLFVSPDFRGRGVARALVQDLLEKHSKPIYLTCRASLSHFYEGHGFREVQPSEMPAYYKRLTRLFGIFVKLDRSDDRLMVMRYE